MNILGGACTLLVATSCVAGCATPAPVPGSESVKDTTALADIADCNMLGKVIVSDDSPTPEKDARDQTATLGGNVLLRVNEMVWNGNAYLCRGAAH